MALFKNVDGSRWTRQRPSME